MEDLIRGAIAGIAVGGFTAAVVDANKIATQALWRFNCLAAETAWVMFKAPLEKMPRERLVAAQTENADNSEPNSEAAEQNREES